jgi:hypothetical protein
MPKILPEVFASVLPRMHAIDDGGDAGIVRKLLRERGLLN